MPSLWLELPRVSCPGKFSLPFTSLLWAEVPTLSFFCPTQLHGNLSCSLWLYRSSLPVFSWFSRGIVPHVGIFLMCAWGEVSFMSSNSAILIQCLYDFFFWKKKNWCLLYTLISIVNHGIHRADKSLLFVHIWTPV